MRWRSLSRFALPGALVAFALTAVWQFRDLPAQVPIHFGADGQADRWIAPKQFIGLNVLTVVLLGGALLAGRHYARTEQVNSDHPYSRRPELRDRVVLVLDLLGAGGLLLVTWVAYHCAQASRLPEPALERFILTAPLGVLLLGAAAAAWWTRKV